jgi:hypothetical protein
MVRRPRSVCGAAVAAAVGVSLAGPSQGLGEGTAQRADLLPPTLDEVQHMCALLTSCGALPIPPSLVPADFAACVRSVHDEMTSPRAVTFSLLLRECGLRSTSCPSLAQCALRGVHPDACTGRGKQGVVGFCDGGGRAVSCWHEEVLAVRDCPRGHEECLVVDGEARCSLGPCPADVREGDKSRCSASETFLLQCDKGKLATLDCSAFGLKCATGTGSGAGCATGGPACASNARRCEGDVAVGCHNGHEVRVDCAAAGLVCERAIGDAPIGACFARASAEGGCERTDTPRCEGATIRYCYAGKTRSYSCKAAGFNGCTATKAGVRCAK